MARRANPAAGPAETEEHDEKTPLEGGSSGVLENAVTETGGGAGKVVASAFREPEPGRPPPPPVKRYEVEGAGPNGRYVLLNGYKALFRDGKIVEDKDYDIAMLRQQGVRLRELT